MQRNLAIDFWRGIALLMIFINHMPGNPLTFITLKRLGFCDAAEIFVFLAGFMTSLTLGRKYDTRFILGFVSTCKRLWILFRAHIMLVFGLSVVLAIAGLFTDSAPIKQEFNFSPFFLETDQAIVRLIRFAYMPNMTDILPLYIVLLLPLPLIWLLKCRAPVVLIGLSALVWWIAPLLMPADADYPDNFVWHFNPFAWQFIFMLGLFAPSYREGLLRMTQNRLVIILAASMALFGFLAAAPWVIGGDYETWRLIPAHVLLYDDKTNLSLLRLTHFTAVAVLAVRAYPWLKAHLPARIHKTTVRLGQNSILIFCSGSIIGLALYIIHRLAEFGPLAYILLTLGGIIILCLLAQLAHKFRQAAAFRPV